MGVQHLAHFLDFRRRHAFGRQAAGHAFERFADFVEFGQFLRAERDHAGAGVRHAHQQSLALEPVQGLAQRAAADAVDARQFRFGNLAAGAISPLTMADWILRKICSAKVSLSSCAAPGSVSTLLMVSTIG